MQKTPESLSIYDPYFCAGSIITHLNGLGFTNVHNRNEDFYAAVEANRVPQHDVVVTNPPYTSDHVEKLMSFLVSNQKPFFVLYVAQKFTERPLDLG